MAVEKAPAFQFYPKDFLMDGQVMAMTLTERGAYITLLCLCWLEGGIPSDIAALARRCHITAAAFTKLWPALEPCFLLVCEGLLVQPRIEREREKQATYRAMKADAGRLGGRPPKAEVIPCLSTTEAKQSPPSSSSSSSSTDVSKNPLPPKGGRITRADRKKAKDLRRQRFGRCHHEPTCDDGTICEEVIAQQLADLRVPRAS